MYIHIYVNTTRYSIRSKITLVNYNIVFPGAARIGTVGRPHAPNSPPKYIHPGNSHSCQAHTASFNATYNQ